MPNVYDKIYDYEDMKLAICVADFFNNCNKGAVVDYEDLIGIAAEIKNAWENEEREDLSEEEYAYVQSYALKYLTKNYSNFGRK